MWRDCPELKKSSGSAPLRITDGRTTPSRAHQMTTEEAQVSAKVVTGTSFFIFLDDFSAYVKLSNMCAFRNLPSKFHVSPSYV